MSTMLGRFRLGALWLGALVALEVPAATPADFLFRNSHADGSGMPYRVFVPPGYNAAQAYPLILFLHGAGERGTDNVAQLNNNANGGMQLVSAANLAVQPVFMAAPQCPPENFWGDGPTNARLTEIVDAVEAEFHIDVDRVYVTGLSMGGYGTWGFVATDPARFAAAVPMSGGGSAGSAAALRDLPFWFFHAVDDGTVGVGNSRALVTALRDAGASVIYTEYATGGHGIWPVAYANPLLFRWIVAQRRGTPSLSAPPLLRILAPTAANSWATGNPSLDLAGSAANGSYAIASVGWDRLGGGTGSASGTATWSAAAVPLAGGNDLLRVTATGTSYYANYGGATTFNDSLRVTGPPPAPGSVVAAINGGGAAYTALDGTVYVADTGYEGGSTQVSSVALANTGDDALYNDWRFGTYAYRLPLQDGPYVVELHFADTYNTAVGQRRFDVAIEGTTVLHEFDIIASAGANAALVRRYTVDVHDGVLDVELRNGSVGNARLDALRVIRAGDVIYRNGFDPAPAEPSP